MSTTELSITFKTRLLDRREVAEQTTAFLFEKPPDWTFRPGQFVDLTVLNPPETDAEGNTRGFSVASAPEEGHLMFATRMRDTACKRVLGSMPIGTEVKIEGPFGNLTLHNNIKRPAVLLAGGIGITPFRSMVVHAAKAKLQHKIVLFYSNLRPEAAAFLSELKALERENLNYRFVPTMTNTEGSHSHWDGERSLINYELIAKHLKPLASPAFYEAGPIYYIAGPPEMVVGIRSVLTNTGVDDDDIRTEEFAGY
jgi:ferredoxin-NADP reductase